VAGRALQGPEVAGLTLRCQPNRNHSNATRESGVKGVPRALANMVTSPMRLFGWSMLIAIALTLAAFVQAVANSTLDDRASPRQMDACQTGSCTTGALSDGDDVRARLLVDVCGELRSPGERAFLRAATPPSTSDHRLPARD
jgi:hypothetical protein